MQLLRKLEKCDWKEFESLIAEILELHNYDVFHNLNLTINKIRRQFDVIANKGDCSLIIDCKKWCNKKTKVSALIKAAEKHLERSIFFGKIFNKKMMIPLIITYNEEPIINHAGVYIVPLHRLNDFILGLL